MGKGGSVLEGQKGTDSLVGFSQGGKSDTLIGGEDGDTLIGTADADLLFGGSTITGGADTGDGADFISGKAGTDTIYGGDGGDTVDGGTGADTIFGGAGDDSLFGGVGGEADSIIGGEGSDTLIGWGGNDTLIGGEGADYFVFSGGTFATSLVSPDTGSINNFGELGLDSIIGFEVGIDKIVLDGNGTAPGFTTPGAGLFANLSVTNAPGVSVVTGSDNASAEVAQGLIVYNKDTGKLFYNPNGQGPGFESGNQFATLDTGLNISSGDFIIV
ncbi:hypothetical protein LAY57_17715 [Argonema antarcticum A004/B2]|nr:hypothetical protein [Argonema antarcticum A004/B2]